MTEQINIPDEITELEKKVSVPEEDSVTEEVSVSGDDNESDDGSEEIKKVIPESRRQQRALAYHYLYVADSNGYDLEVDDIVEAFEENYHVHLDGTDFPVCLAKGVVENRERYASVIEPLLENWSLDRVGCGTRLILYMALWEFEQDDAIASVVINEAVELAKAFAEKDAYRFVNGILDQAKNNYPAAIERDKLQDSDQVVDDQPTKDTELEDDSTDKAA